MALKRLPEGRGSNRQLAGCVRSPMILLALLYIRSLVLWREAIDGSTPPTIQEAGLTMRSSWSIKKLSLDEGPPNPTLIPKLKTLSITQRYNYIRVSLLWLRPNPLSCLKKWRRMWHFLTMDEQLTAHDRSLGMKKPRNLKESTKSTSAPLIIRQGVGLFALRKSIIISLVFDTLSTKLLSEHQLGYQSHCTGLGTITATSVVPQLVTTVMEPVLTVLVVKVLVVQGALGVLRVEGCSETLQGNVDPIPFLARPSSWMLTLLILAWLCVNLQVISQPSQTYRSSSCYQTTLSPMPTAKCLWHIARGQKKLGKSWKVGFHLSYIPYRIPLANVFTITKGGFCKYCAICTHSNKSTPGVLVNIPFTKFSRAEGKNGILTKCASNVYHQEASNRANSFINTYQNPQNRTKSRIAVEAQRLSNTSRHILSEIVQTIFLREDRAWPCQVTGMTALQTL